jgi:hypothetical protein
MRHLRYQGSYSRRHRYRRAGKSSGGGLPARFAVFALLVLAAIMVLASLLQSSYHSLGRG